MSSPFRHEEFGATSRDRDLHISGTPYRDPACDLQPSFDCISTSSTTVVGKRPVIPAIVAIGISTGGPTALEQILPRFPHDFPIPVLIVQHMPRGFTGPLAERLNRLCSIRVLEAVQQQRIKPGMAYIAPAGSHMRVTRNLADGEPTILLDSRRGHALHMPSIDFLMKSVAEIYRNRSIGVIMTGMGSDGAEGMSAIFHSGGLTIGQDESSCAVYGMPRVCAEAGVLTRIAPLSRIPTEIVRATQAPASDYSSDQFLG